MEAGLYTSFASDGRIYDSFWSREKRGVGSGWWRLLLPLTFEIGGSRCLPPALMLSPV